MFFLSYICVNFLFFSGYDWKLFAIEEAQRWASRYENYVRARHPVMVIFYDELEDKRLIQTQLLRLSNFVRVPIKHSALQCIMKHSEQFPLKPRPLKTGFEPFKLLSQAEMVAIQTLENRTIATILKAHGLYRPNV